MITELLSFDWSSLYSTLATISALLGGAGTLIGCLKAKDWKGAFNALNDLMNPFKPQTEEQTAVMAKIEPETYTMTDDAIYSMWQELVKGRANLTLDALQQTVKWAESGNVEYVIVTHDNDGKGETEPDYAFVSYGNYTVTTPAEIEKLSIQHGGLKKFYIGC